MEEETKIEEVIEESSAVDCEEVIPTVEVPEEVAE